MRFDSSTPYIVRDENAQYYECGFSCDNAIVLHLQGQRFFITDSRYSLEAKQSVGKNVEVIESSDLLSSLSTLLSAQGVKKLIFNPSEICVEFYEILATHTQKCQCELLPAPNFHQNLRVFYCENRRFDI